MIKVNVLGAEYTIEIVPPDQDEIMKKGDCDGYTDKTSRKIVVSTMPESDLDDVRQYQKQVIRHELIHAFMNESGLQGNYEHYNKYGQEETMVDWIAIQFPKLLRAFEAADCM
jgi:hypothetical protein